MNYFELAVDLTRVHAQETAVTQDQLQLLFTCAVCSMDYLVDAKRDAGRLVPEDRTECPRCGQRGMRIQP